MTDSIKQYERLVAPLDIPALRKTYSNANALWFIRNAWINNQGHKNYQRAFDLARKLA